MFKIAWVGIIIVAFLSGCLEDTKYTQRVADTTAPSAPVFQMPLAEDNVVGEYATLNLKGEPGSD